MLTTWWDVIQEYRNRIVEAFKSLEYFTQKDRTDPTDIARRNALIVTAAECHLAVKENSDEDEGEEGEFPDNRPGAKIRKTTRCELCGTKLLLAEYECKIFDKAFNEDREEGEGTWRNTYQEWIARHLFVVLKREARTTDSAEYLEAESFVMLLDRLKSEFKLMSKFWIEINYTASAFDELAMCKYQLSAVDPEVLKKGEKLKRNEISIHEIEITRDEIQMELNDAEIAFVRSLRNLSYLRHLSNNPDEVRPCPICDLKPRNKYSVWDCGHQMCIDCLLKMKKYHGTGLNCPVCRNAQSFHE